MLWKTENRKNKFRAKMGPVFYKCFFYKNKNKTFVKKIFYVTDRPSGFLRFFQKKSFTLRIALRDS